jgi:hypothetical protein
MRTVSLLIALLAQAGVVGDWIDDHGEPREAVSDAPPMPLGLVTGAIYETGSSDFVDGEPVFATHGNQIACDIDNLGARWIRVEVKWSNTSDAVYADIIRAARVKRLKVVAVVPGHFCPNQSSNPPFAVYRTPADYVAKLRELTGPGGPFESELPDAWEITNEPNMADNDEASLCGERFRVAPEAYVELLRAVWEWKKTEGRSELIIAGAPLNIYLGEVWWQRMLPALLADAARGDRPFDFFGVHPYNPHWMNFLPNVAPDLSDWEDRTRETLTRLDRTLACIYRRGRLDCGPDEVRGERALFATEFGFQPCPGSENNPDIGANDEAKCVDGEADMVKTFEASVRAMADSGAVAAALYYNYRDDAAPNGARYGLRRRWDGESHPLRLDLADRFRHLAGATRTEPCWPLSADSGIGRARDGSVDLPIVSCHQRNGRSQAAGFPTNNGGSAYVHDWAPAGPVQDFIGGTHGPNLCMRRSSWGVAYMVRGDIREKYFETGGGPGPLGYPIADEADDGAGPYQRFERGRIRAGDGTWIVELD